MYHQSDSQNDISRYMYNSK